MVDMRQATNIKEVKIRDLSVPFPRVVQKGNVGKTFTYGLQLYKGTTYVYRGNGDNLSSKVLELSGDAGGHTQTWEFAGDHLVQSTQSERAGQWFVGTKPSENYNYHWAKQIARVDIRHKSYASSNTEFPRLAFLNRAGKLKKPDRSAYTGADLERAEAALSPDYSKFLLATVDKYGNGYFTIYNADLINNKLDNVASSNGYVNLGTVSYLESFVIPSFYSVVKSVQGYDLDNAGNIYISSQLSPDPIKHMYYAKNIFKIPTYDRTNTSNWLQIDLTKYAGSINIYNEGMHTELESIQVLSENHCYLTVAYHKNIKNKNETVANKIYEVSWDE